MMSTSPCSARARIRADALSGLNMEATSIFVSTTIFISNRFTGLRILYKGFHIILRMLHSILFTDLFHPGKAGFKNESRLRVQEIQADSCLFIRTGPPEYQNNIDADQSI